MGLLDTMKQTNEQQSTTEMLEEWTSRLPAVEPSNGQVEQTLAGFERQVAVLVAQRTVAAAQEVERVVAKADEVLAGVRGAERRLSALEGKASGPPLDACASRCSRWPQRCLCSGVSR